jgi:hypothetical protein
MRQLLEWTLMGAVSRVLKRIGRWAWFRTGARTASAFPIKIIICDDGVADRFVKTVQYNL